LLAIVVSDLKIGLVSPWLRDRFSTRHSEHIPNIAAVRENQVMPTQNISEEMSITICEKLTTRESRAVVVITHGSAYQIAEQSD
jgi:hypothetical protein